MRRSRVGKGAHIRSTACSRPRYLLRGGESPPRRGRLPRPHGGLSSPRSCRRRGAHGRFPDPQTHTQRGAACDSASRNRRGVMDRKGASSGSPREADFSASSAISQGRGAGDARARRCLQHCAAGVGLDSSEVITRRRSSSTCVRAVSPAGSLRGDARGRRGPAREHLEALDRLGVEAHRSRRALARATTRCADALVAEQIPLTMCPQSNLKLKVIRRMEDHNLEDFCSSAAYSVTVNSDDPAYFGGYVLDNYMAVARALGLSRAQLTKLAESSIDASFLAPSDRASAGGIEIRRCAAASANLRGPCALGEVARKHMPRTAARAGEGPRGGAAGGARRAHRGADSRHHRDHDAEGRRRPILAV